MAESVPEFLPLASINKNKMKDVLVLCQHCGHKTSHEILKQGKEIERIEVEGNRHYVIEHTILFTNCNNCSSHSLFYVFENEYNDIASLYPAERRISDNVPKEIANAYKEALKVKKISKYAFIILIRRALEITCKYEKAIGKNLSDKIKFLGKKGIIPLKLTDMADMIRLIGNSSVHEDQIDIDDNEINILEEFFIAIIDYVYSVHGKVELLKKKLKKGK